MSVAAGAVVRRRSVLRGDAFFDAGDAFLAAEQARLHQQSATLAPMGVSRIDGDDALGAAPAPASECDCVAHGCAFRGSSPLALQQHVAARHTHVCASCHVAFARPALLDVHCAEVHDAFFAERAKREAMYACVVSGCTKRFWSAQARVAHMVQQHHMPGNYHVFGARWLGDDARDARGPAHVPPTPAASASADTMDDVQQQQHQQQQQQHQHQHERHPPASTHAAVQFGRDATRAFARRPAAPTPAASIDSATAPAPQHALAFVPRQQQLLARRGGAPAMRHPM